MKYDFSGWATKNDLRCADGRVIRKDAFKAQDGQTVPLVWNHNHNNPGNVLGLAHLENREDGVYVYCEFNKNEAGKTAKGLVEHGDITSLSILANQLKEVGKEVVHGIIREVSLVLAGANPGAFIDTVIEHGVDSDDAMIIGYDEGIALYHADKKSTAKSQEGENVKDEDMEDEDKNAKSTKNEDEETVQDIFNTLTEKQKTVVYGIIEEIISNEEDEKDKSGLKKERNDMKHNVFDTDQQDQNKLTHSDQVEIINLAKTTSCGSLRDAISIYMESNDMLAHGFDSIETLFPDFKDTHAGAPEVLQRDQGWVTKVINGTHKSPYSRIRTRQTDARDPFVRGLGFKKEDKKINMGNFKLLKRTTDPQTVYVKDALNRDDIVDITDFDVVDYQYSIMKQMLNEEIAKAVMIGDGREEGDDHKIAQEHVRSIWHDDDIYCIHTDVDIAATKKELQGTNTSVNFGDNYVYAEAIIQAALYSREKYKGTGTPDFYCTPHLLNVMLLARDLNGRRIYDSKEDLAKALNVVNIETAEQFAEQIRKTSDSKKKKLLGIFVNLADYQIGSTRGGEITKFDQFDIDFNLQKYLIETRLSGALIRAYSAIALEEDVTAAG